MTVTLYAHRLSQPSRAVEILLRELGVPYRWQEVDFANGETRQPWFIERVNAFGTIPALAVASDEDGGERPAFTLGESHAILRYLCRTANDRTTAERWYPGDHDPARAAAIDQWLAWHHNHVRRYDMFHDIMNLHLTLPMLKCEIRDTALKPLQDSLARSLVTLEQHLTHANANSAPVPTLCGDGPPTIADLALGCELYQIVAVGYRFGSYPRVTRWLNAMAARTHCQQVCQAIDDQGQTIHKASGDYLELDAFG